MRSTCIGLLVAGLLCGFAHAQNTPATQPGAAGQKQGDPAGQGQGAVVNPQPGTQAGNNGSAANGFGQTQFTQGQAGQNQPNQNQLNQPGFAGQNQFGQQGQQAGQQGQATSDQQIAACIFGACHNEVELSKWAESKLQTREAKEFAQRMVKDHTPDCETYQRLAGNLAHAGHAGGQQAGAQRAAGQLDWVTIHAQLGKRCLESTEKELSQQKGADIDKAYIGAQLKGHLEMKDKLTVIRDYASQSLQPQIDQSLQGVEKHLQLARNVMEQLKDQDQSGQRSARRGENN